MQGINKKRTLVLSSLIFTVLLLTGCNLIRNIFTYKDKTKELVEYILSNNYDSAVNCFALNRIGENEQSIGKLKNVLPIFRKKLIKNFGESLEYSFMESKKNWSTNKDKSTPKDCTEVQIQYSNGTSFGVFNLIFDDISGKIISINFQNVKRPIPNMLIFWLVGLIALTIPIFNIYIVLQIRKCYSEKKIRKYLFVLFFNVPSITYSAVNGISIKLLSFQILFGIGFGYMGYLGSFWTIGVPVAGLLWFLKIKKLKNKSESATEKNVSDFS